MLEIQNSETLTFAIALSCFNYNHFQIGFLLLCFKKLWSVMQLLNILPNPQKHLLL